MFGAHLCKRALLVRERLEPVLPGLLLFAQRVPLALQCSVGRNIRGGHRRERVVVRATHRTRGTSNELLGEYAGLTGIPCVLNPFEVLLRLLKPRYYIGIELSGIL